MFLELAVAVNCNFIVTFNQRDFQGVEKFGLQVMTPKELLEIIGELR
jgi:predicted nucleic acid-binding protein